jgi:hypothetical protein
MYHYNMALSNAAHVGMMYAQQVTTTSNAKITLSDVVTQIGAALNGNLSDPVNVTVCVNTSCKVCPNFAQPYATPPAPCASTTPAGSTAIGFGQTVDIVVDDTSFRTVTPFVFKGVISHLGGSASGETFAH